MRAIVDQRERFYEGQNLLIEPVFGFSETIQSAPYGPIECHHKTTHHTDAKHDAVRVAFGSCVSNVNAQPFCAQRGVAPRDEFADDTGVRMRRRKR